jgi:hypothetical protein
MYGATQTEDLVVAEFHELRAGQRLVEAVFFLDPLLRAFSLGEYREGAVEFLLVRKRNSPGADVYLLFRGELPVELAVDHEVGDYFVDRVYVGDKHDGFSFSIF